MSRSVIDNDGFTLVKSKRSSKNKQTKIPEKSFSFTNSDIEINISKTVRKINTAVEELKISTYFENVAKSV
nr:uncharacterized protein LOC101740940 isoform X3 [Bombyx mori]